MRTAARVGAAPELGRETSTLPPRRAMSAELSTEERLLLAVTDPRRDASSIAELLDRCTRWSALLHMAHQNGVHFQMATVITRDGHGSRVPPATRQSFARLCRSAFVIDEASRAALREIGSALDAQRLPFILLKGSSLAERVYPQPLERVGEDIDILVPQEAMPRASMVLEELGYRAHHRDFYESEHFHLPFHRPGRGWAPVVELHWQVTKPDSPVAFDLSRWWECERWAELRAGRMRIVPEIDELLYVCHHGFVRGSPTLKDLEDVARLILEARQRLNERECLEVARRTGVEQFWLRAATLIDELWSLGVRPTVEPAHAARRRQWWSRHLTDRRTILRMGRGTWWPFKRVCYWSHLPPEAARWSDLLRRSVKGQRSPHGEGRSGLLARTARVLSLAFGLGLCCLPWRFFPSRFRDDP